MDYDSKSGVTMVYESLRAWDSLFSITMVHSSMIGFILGDCGMTFVTMVCGGMTSVTVIYNGKTNITIDYACKLV